MNEPIELTVPAITVNADPEYALGFPILITVIFRNETDDTDYLDLPALGLLNPIDSLSVELRPAGGGAPTRIEASFHWKEQGLFRAELLAGRSRRSVVDLTQLGATLTAGTYELVVSIHGGAGRSRPSEPVAVRLIDPTPAERMEAARLRALGLRPGAVDTGSWQPFLKSNWNTVAPAPDLGKRAAEQLALHLRLHRAGYGPDSLAKLDPGTFAGLRGPVLSAEAAALEYELIVARGDQGAILAARARVLTTWPELAPRLDEVDRGEGPLTILRKGHGVEKPPPHPAGPRPYQVP